MRLFFLFLGFLNVQLTLAQFGKNCELRQIKINALNPGVEYEMALGVNSTLDFRVAWQASIEPASEKAIEDYEFFPAIT